MEEIEVRKIIRSELELHELKLYRDKLIKQKYQHLLDAENTRQRYGDGSEKMSMLFFTNTEKEITICDKKIYDMDVIARSTP